MKKTGFTLVELLAVIVILAIILAIAIPGISGIIKNSTRSAFASDAKMVLKAIEYKKLENSDFDPVTVTKENVKEILGLSDDQYSQVKFSIVDNKIKVIIVGTNKWDGLTAFGTIKNIKVVNSADFDEIPPTITILGDNPIEINQGDSYTDAGATATDPKEGSVAISSIIIKNNNTVLASIDTNQPGTYTITYTAVDSNDNTATATRSVTVKPAFIANAPVLAAGMTPIKWNESTWVDTTEDDTSWYNYTVAGKKWANARTADGSFWVWVPRYIYKISSGWHTNVAGTIDVQYSMDTDDTRGGTITLNATTAANASNTQWTNHPAFTFGATELTGIWVAKFEAGGTTSAIDIKPNIASLRNVKIGDMFTAARNMETNNRYGWETSGTNLDTHMMKNVEWGAVVYLAQSTYGKNAEIWINNSNTFTTGCAGNSVSEGSYAGCQNEYHTTNGVEASTTGNIYGIYDMSGGVYEYTASYVNNGNANLSNGSVITSAIAKYKDVYSVGAPDNAQNNYNTATNKKGDALYETSGPLNTSNSWYSDYIFMPYSTWPWFSRGSLFANTAGAGGFDCEYTTGVADNFSGFRPVVLVGTGL